MSSLSKAYGVPGIRIGWIITRDPALQELFLAAKEQISICGSVVDEWIAERILENRSAILEPILAEMRRRRAVVADWIAGEELLDWVAPSGGVVCFPRMRAEPPGGTGRLLPAPAGRPWLAMSAPATGSSCPTPSSAWAMAGRPGEELGSGLAAISAALRG